MRAAAQVEGVARQRQFDAERMRCCVGMCGELCAHLCAVLLATTSSAATSRAHSIAGKAVRAHRVASKWDGDGCAPTRRLGSDQSAVSPPRLSSTPSADFPLLNNF